MTLLYRKLSTTRETDQYGREAHGVGYRFQSKARSIPTPAASTTDCNGLVRMVSSR